MTTEMNDPIINEFLNSQTRDTTRRTYKSYMMQYLEFTKKSGQQLLDDKRADSTFQVENSIFAFRKWLLDNGKSEGYASSNIGSIRGFYSYFRMPLVFRRTESKKLTEKNRTTTDYQFDKDDLGKMALVGNLKERYVLLCGKSVGLRASDFLCFTYGNFRSIKLDSDPPISLGIIQTQKERIPAYPFLDSDAIPIVKQILESNKDKLDNEQILTDTEDNLSLILQLLCRKAGMEIENNTIHGKRVRFHCLRKFLIDHLSAYASESQWKQIIGKKISEGAYIGQDQLRMIYAKAMRDTQLNGNGAKVKKLMELETALKAVESENAILKTRIESLQKTITELETAQNTTKEFITAMNERLTQIEKFGKPKAVSDSVRQIR